MSNVWILLLDVFDVTCPTGRDYFSKSIFLFVFKGVVTIELMRLLSLLSALNTRTFAKPLIVVFMVIGGPQVDFINKLS